MNICLLYLNQTYRWGICSSVSMINWYSRLTLGARDSVDVLIWLSWTAAPGMWVIGQQVSAVIWDPDWAARSRKPSNKATRLRRVSRRTAWHVWGRGGRGRDRGVACRGGRHKHGRQLRRNAVKRGGLHPRPRPRPPADDRQIPGTSCAGGSGLWLAPVSPCREVACDRCPPARALSSQSSGSLFVTLVTGLEPYQGQQRVP